MILKEYLMAMNSNGTQIKKHLRPTDGFSFLILSVSEWGLYRIKRY